MTRAVDTGLDWREVGRRDGFVYVGGPGPFGMWVDPGNLRMAKRIVAAVKEAGKDWACSHRHGCVCEAMEVLSLLEEALGECRRYATKPPRSPRG